MRIEDRGLRIEDWGPQNEDWNSRIEEWGLRTTSHLLGPQSSVFIAFETKKILTSCLSVCTNLYSVLVMGHFEKRENGATSFVCPYWEIQLRRRGCRRFWFCGTWRFCRVVWVDTIPFLIYGCHVASDVGNAIGHHISPFCDIVESTVVARAGGKLNTRECLAARCGEPRKLEPPRGCSPSVSIDTKQWQCHISPKICCQFQCGFEEYCCSAFALTPNHSSIMPGLGPVGQDFKYEKSCICTWSS